METYSHVLIHENIELHDNILLKRGTAFKTISIEYVWLYMVTCIEKPCEPRNLGCGIYLYTADGETLT